MFGIASLIISTALVYFLLNKFFSRALIILQGSYQESKNKYTLLEKEGIKLKSDNQELSKILDETVALYDITKQICKSLDEEKVFSNFYGQLTKYIKVANCQFVKQELPLGAGADTLSLALKIDKQILGYLVAKGIKEEDKDKFYILSQQFILGMERAILYHKVQELAITDSLTGVFSRRYYLERANEEIARSKKFKYNFSLLMADIDHFKSYNDRYGHLVGDAILKEVAKVIRENVRQIDLVGRYGGEEFSFIFTETDKEEAGFAAERIRQAIEEKTLRPYDEDLKVTISIGIAGFPRDGKDIKSLIDKADAALYQAKNSGRNRVVFYEQR